MLEALCHTHNTFVTLTYKDEELRLAEDQEPTLQPRDVQLWLKKFREAVSPLRIRFFAVGEYGETSHRPHYHVIIFGWRGCSRYRTRRALGTNRPDPESCCAQCRLVFDTWGLGNIELGEVNPKSASYIAQYTVKKMTGRDDPRLFKRHPEFARMSLRPGIGAESLWEVANTMLRVNLEDRDDVPNVIQHGDRILPLGRYLRRKLREYTGKEVETPQSTLDKMAEEMRPLREAAFDASASFAEVVKDAGAQKALDLETILSIRKKGKPL